MLTEQLLNWQTKVTDGLLTGSINTSCLCLWPQIYSRTARGQSSIMQHRSAGEKPVGKFAKTASPWSHLSLRNLLCCSLYLPFLHLSHCTVPCLSLLSIILSPFWLAHSQPRPALSHYTLSMPLSCSTFPTHFISFICSVFLSCSDSHSPHICRKTRQCWKWGALTPAVAFKTECGYQPFNAPPPVKYVLNSGCQHCHLYLSVSRTHLPLPSVSLQGWKVDHVYYVEYSNPIWCCFQPLNQKSAPGCLQVLAS